jgi:uncharacterized protein
MTRIVNCPTCGKQVNWEQSSRFRPFCCERCQLIDLGDWLGERHRIAGQELVDQVPESNDPPTEN